MKYNLASYRDKSNLTLQCKIPSETQSAKTGYISDQQQTIENYIYECTVYCENF